MLSLKHSPRVLIMILLALPLSFSNLKAQSIISPEKVKECFMHPNDTTILEAYDRFTYDETVNFRQCIAPSLLLRKAGNISIPPSYWGLMIGSKEKGYKYQQNIQYLEEGEHCMLCWMGLRKDSLGKGSKLQKKLKRRYGSIKDKYNSIEGIPATWLTGEITILMGVGLYGGIYTCFPDTNKIERGYLKLMYRTEIFNSNPTQSSWNYFDAEGQNVSKRTLYSELFDLAPELYRTLDSKENYQRSRWAQMLLLAYEANKHCPSSFNKYHVIKDLPIYVYMRKDGRCEMLVLDDSKLKEEDLPYVNELAASLPQMPPLLLSLKFTIDGEMMPGIILYASHDGAWTFREVDQEK